MMVATKERRRSFTELEGGVETAWSSAGVGCEPVLFEPVDLVLLDVPGWRGLARGRGWDTKYLRSLDELVDRWLMGVDRRRLLEIAGKRLSTGSGKLDFRDLVVEWLDPGCLENLVTLVRASQDPFPVYPVCYALGKAFNAADIAMEHLMAGPDFSDEELMLVPADDGVGFDDEAVAGDSAL